MHKTIALFFSFFFCQGTSSLQAAFSDFEDLIPNTSYRLGDTFESSGVSFEVVAGVLADPNDSGRVFVYPPNGTSELFSGNGVAIGPRTGLSIVIPAGGVQILSYSFFDFSASALTVNGMSTPYPGHLPSSDGQMFGDVLIEVEAFLIGNNPNRGRVTLTGLIQSLVLNGSEMGIDNLSFVVPEPSAIVLLLVFLGPLVNWRLRYVGRMTRSF